MSDNLENNFPTPVSPSDLQQRVVANNPPTTKYQVGGEKWRCCNHVRKTEYCPECGKKRPEKQWSSRIDDILQNWEQEKYVCEKIAQTLQDKMTRCEIALERIDAARTWEELIAVLGETGIGSWRVRGQKELENAKQLVSDGAKLSYSQNAGNKNARLRKAAHLGYWIETVRELISMIPQSAQTPANEAQEQAKIPAK